MMQTSHTLCPALDNLPNSMLDHPLVTMLDQKCTTMRDLKKIHAQMIKTGLHKDTLAISRVLAFAATSPRGDVNYALSVFNRIDVPNLFTWNTIMRGFAGSSTPETAISLFVDMLVDSSVPPHRLTYPSLFKAYAQMGQIHYGAQLHGRVVKVGLDSAPFIRNAMIYMYANSGCLSEASKLFDEDGDEFDVVAWNSFMLGLAKCGRVEECRNLFEKMGQRRRNPISWNTMISACVRQGKLEDAFDLFDEMQYEMVKPSEFTMVSMLNASAHLGALERGEWIHRYICKKKMEQNSVVTTAIINMYCKCGAVDKARTVFRAVPNRGLPCWNSMILGLANNGFENEAIELFTELESLDIKPDEVTFIGVLTACTYLGHVSKARDYFVLMSEKYGIEPSIRHYNCMVEGLGQTGLLGVAERLIKSMPMKPDAVIWGSLLSASRKHGDVEMAVLASKHLKELDFSDSSGYVLMSNVYAASGQYETAIDQRISMKKNQIVKERGGSSIQIAGEVRDFTSGGRLKTDAEELMLLL